MSTNANKSANNKNNKHKNRRRNASIQGVHHILVENENTFKIITTGDTKRGNRRNDCSKGNEQCCSSKLIEAIKDIRIGSTRITNEDKLNESNNRFNLNGYSEKQIKNNISIDDNIGHTVQCNQKKSASISGSKLLGLYCQFWSINLIILFIFSY